jgi:hypothetical protein
MPKPYTYRGCIIELTKASVSVRRGRYGRPERLTSPAACHEWIDAEDLRRTVKLGDDRAVEGTRRARARAITFVRSQPLWCEVLQRVFRVVEPLNSPCWPKRGSSMISLLIGVGAFLLAMIASVTFDPRRSREDADDHTHAMDVTTLPI